MVYLPQSTEPGYKGVIILFIPSSLYHQKNPLFFFKKNKAYTLIVYFFYLPNAFLSSSNTGSIYAVPNIFINQLCFYTLLHTGSFRVFSSIVIW